MNLTVDYAELENGSWRIIEAGDGVVSGLSEFKIMNSTFGHFITGLVMIKFDCSREER